MSLDDTTQQALKELLRDCTANVQVDGASKGTAFFLSNTLLLTCHHVVDGRDEVDVVPSGRKARRATVVQPNPGKQADLALLRVEIVDSEEAPPSVLIQTPVLIEGDYFVAGFPREQGEEAGLEAFTVKGHRRDGQDGSVDVLELQAGKQITFGMSGGPVLSLDHGAVVGVTRKSKDTEAALGGGAVPMSKATEAYPEVAQLLSDPPVAVRRWRDTLGPTQWQLLTALPWEMTKHIDLVLTGSRNKWCIKSEVTPEDGELLSAPNLGDDLTDAMFRWAQRRRLSGRAEVNLLGRLLAKALFPAAVSSDLKVLGQADQVTVRLHIGRDRDLADIPWEFAGVPDRAEAFLAADPHFRFLRVDDQARPRPLPPVGNGINVLGVICLPEQWEFPELRYGESRYTWPKTTSITRGLGSHFAANPYAFKPMVNPTIAELRKELEEGSYDVLHYVGVVTSRPRGRRGCGSWSRWSRRRSPTTSTRCSRPRPPRA